MSEVQKIERACARIAERNGWTWALTPLDSMDASVLVVCFADAEHYCLLFLTPESVAGVKGAAAMDALIEGMLPTDYEREGWDQEDAAATLH